MKCLSAFSCLALPETLASIEGPTIKVNRLLLRNVSIIGAAWGEAIAADPALARDIHARLIPLVTSGAVAPPIGKIFSFDDAVEAFRSLDDRSATAKVLFEVNGE